MGREVTENTIPAEAALVDGAVAMAWTAIDAATDPVLRDRLLSTRS